MLTEDVLGALLHLRARDRLPNAVPAVASFADVTYLNLTAVGLTRLNAVSGGLLPNLKALVVAGNLLARLDDLSQSVPAGSDRQPLISFSFDRNLLYSALHGIPAHQRVT